MSHRAITAFAVGCSCAALFTAGLAVAQTTSGRLEEGFSRAVTACDRVTTGSDVTEAANAANLTLAGPLRVADTPLGADPNTGVTAFFGADTQIQHAMTQENGGFFVFIAAADVSKCEAMAVGLADLAGAGGQGLANGARDWLPSDDQHEMRRANGDQVLIQMTTDNRGVQIVDLRFVRGQRP